MTTEQKPTKPEPQKLKKSETLEVRIPYETKQAFLTACREDGTTASEVVRDKVQSYLDERERPQTPTQPHEALIMKFPEPVRRYAPRIAASGVAAIALATFVALPSAAQQDFQSQFKRLDANGDGVVTVDEFSGRFTGGKDGDKESNNVVVETRIQRSGDGSPPAKVALPAVNQDAFTFWLPDELGGPSAPDERRTMTFVSRSSKSSSSGDAAAAPPVTMSFSLEDLSKREFEGMDSNKDGKLSFAEYQVRQTAMLTRGFEILDANSDKSLSQAEYEKIASPPMPKIPGLDDKDGPRVQIMAGAPKYTPAQLKTAFTKLDANKDKKLSLQEYLPPA